MTIESPQHHYSATLSYDGAAYYGWQRLRDHPTVQAALESTLARCVGGDVPVRGAGRTDRGAHAEGQVAGFALTTDLDPVLLLARLAEELPPDIDVLEVVRRPPSFHVRTSATEKTYEYRVVNAPSSEHPSTRVWHLKRTVDVERLRSGAQHLVGLHDFASFATKPRYTEPDSHRDLREASVALDGDLIVMRFRANSFLNHMVRNMVGALVRVGDGSYEPDRIRDILAAKDRSASPGSAPACGLYLMQVLYDND